MDHSSPEEHGSGLAVARSGLGAVTMCASCGVVMQMRAQIMARDTTIAALREDLQTLEAAAPDLKGRFEQAREIERLVERNHELQGDLLRSQQEAERLLRRSDDMAAELWRRAALTPNEPEVPASGVARRFAAEGKRNPQPEVPLRADPPGRGMPNRSIPN